VQDLAPGSPPSSRGPADHTFVPAHRGRLSLMGAASGCSTSAGSVDRPTREIAPRKAIGASDSAILSKFIMEASRWPDSGGFIGCGLGVGMT